MSTTHKVNSTTHLVTLDEAESFFYEHAGYSHRLNEPRTSGRARRAILLAEAERELARSGASVTWEDDDAEWAGDFPLPSWATGPYTAIIWNEAGEMIGSLGAIWLAGDDTYRRVVAAELAAQYL